MTDDTYMQWVAHYQTSLKASRLAASDQPASDLWVVPSKGIMRAKLLEEDAAYWIVGDATINGDKVPTHINIAYKPHWARPIEIIPAQIEDDVEVAESRPPEAAVPESALADPHMETAVEPVPSLWQRLFRRRF